MPDFFQCKMKGEQAVRGEGEVRARGSQRTEKRKEGRNMHGWLVLKEDIATKREVVEGK